jgi:membrane-associated HD superfamily phosphohydrolase
MNKSANRLVCLIIIFGINLSCTNRSNENRVDSLDVGLQNSNDTILNYRDGTPINHRMGNMDTIQLPKNIVEAIENDSLLKNALIVEKKENIQDSDTLYLITFHPANGKEERVIFDSKGKRKSNP